MRRSVYCTASFSICSLRRTKVLIIYPEFPLDYKLATLPTLRTGALGQLPVEKRAIKLTDDSSVFTTHTTQRDYKFRVRGRLCFPAKPQDGGAQGQGDPQRSAPGFQPLRRWSARLQPLTRERWAVFPHAQAVSSHLDEIAGWQRTKCQSSWKATPPRYG